jgi:KDO2-lipid IV(A) lauroyltransferase
MPSDRTFWSSPLAPLRYAVVGAMQLLMRVLVRFPMGWQLKLCEGFGLLARLLTAKRRWVVATNLRLCFPQLDAAARNKLARAHFCALGASFAEMAMGWYGPIHRIRPLIEIRGAEHLQDALAKGRGVILYTGHFTSFEIFFPVLAALCPRLCGMYKEQRNPLMNQVMTAGRHRSVDLMFSNENVRGMLRELASNSVFWYASDQSYLAKGAALIPFFGEPAMTNTAISRIARISGAVLLPHLFQRLPGKEGYRLTIEPPIDAFPSNDPIADTLRLNELLEKLIRRCPEQYWWVHQRFKGRPPPLPDVYADPDKAAAPRGLA